jgi:hypothetical protein
MALQRAPPSFSAAVRDEALRVARDIGKHTAALGDGVDGADAVVRESAALVTALSSGEPNAIMLQDGRMQSRRVTCAVHDLLCSWENAVQRTIATRATEATHATASDISGLLRSAIAKQDAPEQRESARRNVAQLEALMVARSLQVSDADVLADVATQCQTVRQAMDEFLADLARVRAPTAVESSVVEGSETDRQDDHHGAQAAEPARAQRHQRAAARRRRGLAGRRSWRGVRGRRDVAAESRRAIACAAGAGVRRAADGVCQAGGRRLAGAAGCGGQLQQARRRAERRVSRRSASWAAKRWAGLRCETRSWQWAARSCNEPTNPFVQFFKPLYLRYQARTLDSRRIFFMSWSTP